MSGTTAATVGDIVSAAITELSQVPGQATQIYSTPRMQQYVQNAVLLELEEMWWAKLMFYLYDVPIDGTTGVPTLDLVSPFGGYLDDYSDINAVFPADSNRSLTVMPRGMNPGTLRGQTSRFYISPGHVTHRPLIVWPPYAHSVTVYARHRPVLPMSMEDRIWLDRLLILYDVCWMYAVDDGTIPAQVNKFQVLAANRRRRMKAADNSHPIPLDPSQGTYDSMMHDDTFFVLDQDPLA
jgi:hypothetical protein